MSGISIDFKWRDVRGAPTPAIASTMADLRIEVDGEPVTRVFDRRIRTTRDEVFVSLYPLAEWIAAHWWTLFEENMAPGRDSVEFAVGHDLGQAGEGFAFPSLSIQPEGEQLLLRWTRRAHEQRNVEFLSEGNATLRKEDVQDALRELVRTVLGRLEALKSGETWLAEEWRRIESMAQDQQEFCRSAARLGLDPFDLSEYMENSLLDVLSTLPGSLSEDFLRAIPVDAMEASATWIRDGVRSLADRTLVEMPALESIRGRLSLIDSPVPWKQGYQLAQDVRQCLLGASQPPIQLSAILPVLPHVLASAPPTGSLDGLVAGSQNAFCCYSSKKRENAQRFLVARALGTFLEGGRLPALLSGAQTTRQARNRAFAAELLAPADEIRRRLPPRALALDDVEELSREFQVSSFVIQHQINNHRLATILD